MLWFIALAVAFLVAVYAFFFCRAMQTAWIVVHPWDLGGTRGEAESALRAIDPDAQLTDRDYSLFIERHEEYYPRITAALKKCRFVRVVILLEKEERVEETYPRVKSMIGSHCLLIHVASKSGRATPDEGSWEIMVRELNNLGIHRVFILGSYLGIHEGQIVDPRQKYFCVNDTFFRLQRSGHFRLVEAIRKYCYVTETSVPELPSETERERNRERIRREKKKKKKQKKEKKNQQKRRK